MVSIVLQATIDLNDILKIGCRTSTHYADARAQNDCFVYVMGYE